MHALARGTLVCLILFLLLASGPLTSGAQGLTEVPVYTSSESTYGIPPGIGPVELFPLIRSGSFTQDGVFEVPIAINTKGASINTIELQLRFDPQILSVVKPSSGNSILNLWIESPTYNNTTGEIQLTGFVRNGIITSSGVITTLTFRAIKPGQAQVEILPQSRVLLNDGLGTQIGKELVRGTYTILPKPPGAVRVYSETHPLPARWYNNSHPSFAWDAEATVSGYSVVLDDKPNTIPDNEIDTNTTTIAFEDVPDGISYFHIKPLKSERWGETTHFQVRIDTEPPADFKPSIATLRSSTVDQVQFSFFTTDELSGLDHYEIGVSDTNTPEERPIFVQAESPYVMHYNEEARVVIRAFDQAGNVRDVIAPVSTFSAFLTDLKDTVFVFISFGFVFLLLFFVLHFLFAHHIVEHSKQTYSKLKEIVAIIQRK